MNGLTIQWGNDNTAMTTIPFYIPFSSTSYATNVGFYIDGVGSQSLTKYTDKMVTSFQIRHGATDCWIAIGYS